MLLPIVLVLVCSALLVWVKRPKKPDNFPPGPPTTLVFGNLPSLIEATGDGFLTFFKSLRTQYKSNVIGLVGPFGNQIHVFGADLIKEASSKIEFSGRPALFPALYMTDMQRAGIFFNEGTKWQEHRRFSLKHLRELGMGRNVLNEIITDEYDTFSQERLLKSVGKPIKANKMFGPSVINVIWKMVADKRYSVDDPEILHFQTMLEDFSQVAGPQSLIAIIPWTRFIMPKKSGFAGLVSLKKEMNEMIVRVIKEHREVLDVENPRDLIDAFLIEMQKPDAKERGYDDLNLIGIASDYFVAGSETTATSLTWGMLLMMLHPDIQKRVQSELDAVLTDGRSPRYEDRNQMPFTEAVVNEVFRFASFTPLTVPHNTSFGAATVAGYTIPHDTLVFQHLHSAHHDPDYWGDPEVFRPERFIDQNGKFRKDDNLMAFGVGRRACIGEPLARMEFFLFLCCLLKQFTIRFPEGATPPNMEPPFGIFLQPGEYQTVLELRKQASE